MLWLIMMHIVGIRHESVDTEHFYIAPVPTLDHKVSGSNPARGGLQLMTVQHFIAQSLLLSSFHCLNMT